MNYQRFGAATVNGMEWSPNLDTIYAFSPLFDSYLEQQNFSIFIVVDGASGCHEEMASGLITQSVVGYLLQKVYLPMIDNSNNNKIEEEVIERLLTESVKLSNKMIRQQAGDMGATLTIAIIYDEMAYIANVGDCRAYWISREGNIHQITRDHTVVQRLIELGKMKPEEAAVSEQKDLLYRALGMQDEIEVDTFIQTFSSQSQLLLCSKGLWHMVSDDEIAQIVKNSVEPQETCDVLVKLTKKQVGVSDISVILIPFD